MTIKDLIKQSQQPTTLKFLPTGKTREYELVVPTEKQKTLKGAFTSHAKRKI